MRLILTFITLFTLVVSISAQNFKFSDIRDDVEGLHDANDAAIKTISPNRGLIEPRQLNPRMGDLEKIYFNIDPQDGVFRLLTGDLLAAKLRYRLFDQIMEVEYQGETFAMDLKLVKAFSIGEDNFILLPDLLGRQSGRVIHQVHYADDHSLVLEQHWTEEDHREKLNNVPSADSQLLRRSSDLMLVVDGKVTDIDSVKDVYEALQISKRSKTDKYIRANKLKLRKGSDLAQLVKYLASNAGK